jgi:hypothetical protein
MSSLSARTIASAPVAASRPPRTPRPDPRPAPRSRPLPPAAPVVARPPAQPSRGVALRRRVVVGALVVAVAGGALALGFGVGQAGAEIDGDPVPTPIYVVQPGDTLWAIAGKVAPEVATPKAVAELRRVAGGASLSPGQRIPVPASLR